MIALDEIRQMSFHEKLQAMEALWEDITREEGQLEVPQWHKNLLDGREALERGEIRVLDWEDAKKEIEASIQ